MPGHAFNPRGTGAFSNNVPRMSTNNVERSWLQKQSDGLNAILCTPLSLLLVFVPLGIYAGLKEMRCLYVFGANFLAIVPLAGILGASTEALASHTGQTLGGLMNATFGNAVEMIVTINAIRAGMVSVVQASLIGSILSNLLLVMGMAFIASGFVSKESDFNITGAAANITCLVLASMALTMPTCFSYVEGTHEFDTVEMSRICAAILALVYVLFLVFQLKTHQDLFVGDDEEEEEAELDALPAMAMLFITTCAVAYCSEFLVDSISEVSENYDMPKAFIGTILLPIVGNAAEHTTAVTAAYKGKMDLALGVAVGSSTQIALFVVPFSVIVGWCYGVPMTLDFKMFQCTVFLLSVFIASSVLGDGHANWFEGVMLCASYCIVGVICWFIPEVKDEGVRSLTSVNLASGVWL